MNFNFQKLHPAVILISILVVLVSLGSSSVQINDSVIQIGISGMALALPAFPDEPDDGQLD